MTKTKQPATVYVYQMKVKLEDISPPIWRRIQVTNNTTLGKLHRILAIFDYPPGKVKQDKDSFQESKHKGRSRPSLNGDLLLSGKT